MCSYHRLGNYEIIQQLGHGGMGGTLLAKDLLRNHDVALKRIRHTGDPQDEEMIEATRRGIELQNLLGQIDPNHIPKVYEYGDIQGFFFAAMEYIEGEDLSIRLAEGRLQAEEAGRIAREVLTALSVAHTYDGSVKGRSVRGILHGDVKPSNIRLTPRSSVYLIDFGIAKELSVTTPLTTGQFGTAQYLSPESLTTGKLKLTDDLWAMGIVLFQMVTGRVPFSGPNRKEIEKLILSRPPTPAMPTDCPVRLQEIIRRALAANLADRYPTADMFRQDIVSFLQSLQPEKTRRTIFPAGHDQPTPPPASPPEKVIKNRSATGKKYPLAIMLGIVILTMIFLGYGEIRAWNEAGQLATRLQNQPLLSFEDAETSWRQYEKLKRGSYLKPGLESVRGPLKRSLIALADKYINAYSREESPNVNQGDWRRVSLWLRRAVELDSLDVKTKAKLNYSEGHEWWSIVRNERGKERLPQAINSFEAAISLWSDWADPYLCLAQICAYDGATTAKPINLPDCLNKLDMAEKYGLRVSRRNIAIRGDAWQKHARLLQSRAGAASGTPLEIELLQESRGAHLEAQGYFRQVSSFGNSAANSSSSSREIDRIERRLIQLGIGPQ